MPVTIAQCSVFIHIWIDTNSAQAGTTKGIYLIDNRVSSGSQNEGSPTLTTACTLNSYICWQVYAVDPNFTAIGGVVAIQQIGNSNAWGNSGQPEQATGGAFTGQVQNAGTASYQITFTVQSPGQSGITIPVTANMSVAAAAAGLRQHHTEKAK